MMVPPSGEENRRESLRRIQLGVGGLAGVLLLVGLTNVLVDNIRKDNVMSGLGSTSDGSMPSNAMVTPAPALVPTEPLADLGVTPAPDASKAQPVPAVPDLEPDPKLQKPMDRDPRQQ